ncbi:uncharacterized protein G2W53_007167 [Senna tora]|uniref:Uncharacterized protein n=1 Tax=Senna tora TaxID=362788 RepID=A0A834X679_9FABA|nr:uncharacterized protein G2W53_007167 [Senna tora]
MVFPVGRLVNPSQSPAKKDGLPAKKGDLLADFSSRKQSPLPWPTDRP